MWVRAQVDYLQRLPTDTEKRKALKKLPPDLPQTYVHILEIIDSTYPPQTTQLIQRLLRWLVLEISVGPRIYGAYCSSRLTSRMLCQAICIENESDRLADNELPTEQQILGWLGCLVRRRLDDEEEMIELSHFTIKEFLRMEPESISSAAVRKYLVQGEDYNYLVQVCLTHLMHDIFRGTTWSNYRELDSFSTNHPLYAYVTSYLCDYIYELTKSPTGMNAEVKCIVQRFLSVPVHESFLLWDTCNTGLLCVQLEGGLLREDSFPEPEVENAIPPLHFASLTGLVDEGERLCRHGLDPNCRSVLFYEEMSAYTPLHLALVNYPNVALTAR